MNCPTFSKLVLLIGIAICLAGANKTMAQVQADTCAMPPLPVIPFPKNVVTLNAAAKLRLDATWESIKLHPTCIVQVTGFGYATADLQQMSWDRVASVINYLKKKGIDSTRFSFRHGYEGDINSVDIVGLATDDAPHWVAQPMPCLSHRLPVKKRCKTPRN